MHDVATSPDPGGRVSVLLIEDEFLIAMETEAILTANGYTVVGIAASVDKAMQLLDRLRPDVAVLDANLRGYSVRPVAKRLKALAVPFVLASAYSFDNTESSDILVGVVNVGKPIREPLLLEALQSVLPAQ